MRFFNSLQGRSLFLGSIHTPPDIFESATFSFRIQKFPRSHVVYSNGIRLSRHIRWLPELSPRVVPPYWSVRNWTRYFASSTRFIEFVPGFFFHSRKIIRIRCQNHRKSYQERKSCGFKNILMRVDKASGFREFREPNISFVLAFFRYSSYTNKEIYAKPSKLEIFFFGLIPRRENSVRIFAACHQVNVIVFTKKQDA